MTESDVQALVRLEYAKQGYRLFRNNVGQLMNDRGVPVRYGLANESAALNARLKSHDLIGWRARLITPDMVGGQIAQFVSLEIKASNWTPARSGDRFEHEEAQRRWLDLVVTGGGYSTFLTGVD